MPPTEGVSLQERVARALAKHCTGEEALWHEYHEEAEAVASTLPDLDALVEALKGMIGVAELIQSRAQRKGSAERHVASL